MKLHRKILKKTRYFLNCVYSEILFAYAEKVNIVPKISVTLYVQLVQQVLTPV